MSKFLAYVPIVILAVSVIGGFFKLQAQTENTKVKVEELAFDLDEIAAETADEIDKVKDENKELDKKIDVNENQQKNIEKKVDEVSAKTNQIYELLLQQAEKKKK